jgi:hypothetical protein
MAKFFGSNSRLISMMVGDAGSMARPWFGRECQPP